MRLYGEVRHSHGPLFRWTAKRHKHHNGSEWEWVVKVHTQHAFFDIAVTTDGSDMMLATRDITAEVLRRLEE